MITGIVVALADEINSLTNRKIKKGDCLSINDTTLLVFSGAGPKNASAASQRLIDKGAERLISWGCAAALDNRLSPGDLVIPHRLLSENKEVLPVDSNWLQGTQKLLQNLDPVSGILTESSSIIAAGAEKEVLYQKTHAQALDMESIAIAKTAQKHQLAFLAIRCIADPVNMSLPKPVSYALNQQGDVVLAKLFYCLLLHPQELPGLIRLGRYFNAAKKKLTLVARQLDKLVSI